jgi:hypothetical protein
MADYVTLISNREETEMEDNGTELDNFSENKQARLPYHAPELVNLGQIQAIIRTGSAPGPESGMGTTCAS